MDEIKLIERLTVIKAHPWRGIGIGGKVPVCMGIVPLIDIVPAFEQIIFSMYLCFQHSMSFGNPPKLTHIIHRAHITHSSHGVHHLQVRISEHRR